MKGLNGSIAESTFAWFRGYARCLNTMTPLRHRFLVLLYVKMHNQELENGSVDYLNEHSATGNAKRKSKSYSCTKKPAAKASPKW